MEMEKLLKEIYDYSMYSEKKGLENIKILCEELGNPQKNYKIIHIAGTNGKGSTSTMIEKVLLAKGYKVGKFTSPHILKFNERICLNGKDISDEDIIKYYDIIKKIVVHKNLKPTFFEIITAMMFKYFSDKKIEYLVLEVGLGGRLDSTNIANGDIVVITNISYDHMEILGNSLEEIAKEKVGIIKENSYVIIGDDKEELKNVIKKEYVNVLEKYKSSSYELDFKEFKTNIYIEDKKYTCSLFGGYQYRNFLCAYEVLKKIGIDDKLIQKEISNVYWPGRLEILKKEKIIILDGAHNEDGIEKLLETLTRYYKKDEIVAIVSILKDKNYNKMLEKIEEKIGKIIYTSLSENKRGQAAKELYDISKKRENEIYEENILKAYEKAKSLKDKKVILICGSFYLISKFKREVLKDEN